MQYDDAGVENDQLVQTKPDETQKAAQALAQRAPGKYFAVRLLLGAALIALSVHVSIVVKRVVGKDDLKHLDTSEYNAHLGRTPPLILCVPGSCVFCCM